MFDSQHPALLIDASSPHIHVGLLANKKWLALETTTEQALNGVFEATQTCLAKAQLSLEAISAFIHCQGPGSVLAIRIAAMAIQSWKALPHWKEKPIYSYQSLILVAEAIRLKENPTSPIQVISEGRQNYWNLYSDVDGSITLLDEAELNERDTAFYHLQQRKTWHKAPEQAVEYTLEMAEAAALFSTPGLLTQVDEPIIFETNSPQYKKWNAERHRKAT